MSEKLLTMEEVARYLGMSEETVKELVAKGEMPAYKIGGSFLRFKKDQVDVYNEKRGFSGLKREGAPKHNRAGGRSKDLSGTVKGAPYTFWEKLEDFLYYNDFYILSLLLLALITLAVFEF